MPQTMKKIIELSDIMESLPFTKSDTSKFNKSSHARCGDN